MEDSIMENNMLIGFHRSALSNYKELLEEGSGAGAVSNESIAYNILEHSGMLYRYTADSSYLDSLLEMDTEFLLVNGFKYVKALNLLNPLNVILEEEEVSDVQMQDLEFIIAARDELEAFCNTVYQLLKDNIGKGDYSFVSDLAAARAYANEFDRTAGKDPALMSIAASDFSWLRNVFAIECKREDYWWMYLSEEFSTAEKVLRDSIESVSSSPEAMERLLEYRDNRHLTEDPMESEFAEEDKVKLISIVFSRACESARIPFAAKKRGMVFSAALIWDGASDCFSICGAEQGEQTASGCYARLVNEFADEEDGSASAQWQIHGADFTGKAKSTFYLLARDTQKVIGTGLVDTEGYAVLGNASWNEVKEYAADYSRLILLIVKKEVIPPKET
jgi:hypothetical protein